MRSRTPTGIIRKLVFGESPRNEGMAFQVGGSASGGEISSLVEDENHFFLFGKTRFLVYVSFDNKKTEVLWKGIEGVPVTIEYDLNQGVSLV